MKEMLGSAEAGVSPRRIQIGFPLSKKKRFFILTPAFPYNPFSPSLIRSALFRQRFDVCTTRSKRARLGSYPGIIKCPWVLARALHNCRKDGEGKIKAAVCGAATPLTPSVTASGCRRLQRTGRMWRAAETGQGGGAQHVDVTQRWDVKQVAYKAEGILTSAPNHLWKHVSTHMTPQYTYRKDYRYRFQPQRTLPVIDCPSPCTECQSSERYSSFSSYSEPSNKVTGSSSNPSVTLCTPPLRVSPPYVSL